VTELEKLALSVAMLTAAVGQLMTQIDSIQHDLDDLRDIWRGCACFGTQDQIEVP